MEDTAQLSLRLIDFVALGRGKDPSVADGHIGVYESDNKHLIAIATLSPNICPGNLSKLDRALRDSGFMGRNPSFAMYHDAQPGAPYFIMFDTFEFAMEAELDLLIDYLDQSGVLRNPIVCDLRWIKLKNSKN